MSCLLKEPYWDLLSQSISGPKINVEINGKNPIYKNAVFTETNAKSFIVLLMRISIFL